MSLQDREIHGSVDRHFAESEPEAAEVLIGELRDRITKLESDKYRLLENNLGLGQTVARERARVRGLERELAVAQRKKEEAERDDN